MPGDEPTRVTRLLEAVERGERGAGDRLFAAVYGELRRLARGRMARERPGQTIQPTALVNEVYLRMIPGHDQSWQNRAHFFGAVAESMRRILVDRARSRAAGKHGGGQRRVPLAGPGDPTADGRGVQLEALPSTSGQSTPDLIELDRALRQLAEQDPRKARVIELRYFLGLSIDETAELVGVSPRTIDQDWRLAKAWLRRELEGSDRGARRPNPDEEVHRRGSG